MQRTLDREYARSSFAALGLLAITIAGILAFHDRHRLPYPVVISAFLGALLSIRLLHLAWTDIVLLPISPGVRWRLRLQMAFIAPIAGPLYWLRFRPVDQQSNVRCS